MILLFWTTTRRWFRFACINQLRLVGLRPFLLVVFSSAHTSLCPGLTAGAFFMATPGLARCRAMSPSLGGGTSRPRHRLLVSGEPTVQALDRVAHLATDVGYRRAAPFPPPPAQRSDRD